MHRHGLFQLNSSVPTSRGPLHRILSSPASDSLDAQKQVFALVQAGRVCERDDGLCFFSEPSQQHWEQLTLLVSANLKTRTWAFRNQAACPVKHGHQLMLALFLEADFLRRRLCLVRRVPHPFWNYCCPGPNRVAWADVQCLMRRPGDRSSCTHADDIGCGSI